MRAHHQQSESASPANSSEQSPSTDQRIESFLDRLQIDTLHSNDGTISTEATREEMRSHLLMLIEAYIELGETEEQAISSALRQFGKESVIKRAHLRSSQPGDIQLEKRTWRLTLLGFAAAYIMTLTIIPMGIRVANDTGSDKLVMISNLGLFGLPVIVGLLTGMFSDRRSVRNSMKAAGLMMAPNILLDALRSQTLGPTMWQIGLATGTVVFVFWTLASMLGAAVGAGTRRLVKRVIAR